MGPAAAVVLGVVLAGACSRTPALPGPPAELAALAAVIPPDAAERGLAFTLGDGGFGSSLPLGALDEIGVGAAAAVLETGPPALTALRVPEGVDEAVLSSSGYDPVDDAAGDWRVVARAADEPPNGPVAAAVPAVAYRDDVVVLGALDEVVAATRSDGAPGWVERLAAAAPVEATVAALGRAPVADRSRGAFAPGVGQVPVLAPYDGWLFAWTPGEGVVALAYPESGQQDQAGALVVRLAVASATTGSTRTLADEFAPGRPRWLDEHAFVVVPLGPPPDDLPGLRRQLEAGLPALTPGEA